MPSRRNRYNLAGRITAATASNGRVLVAHPDNYGGVVGKMLESLVPDADVVNWKSSCNVTLAEFSQLKDINFNTVRTIIALAGPSSMHEARLKVWVEVVALLADQAIDKIQIEFAFGHSRCPPAVLGRFAAWLSRKWQRRP